MGVIKAIATLINAFPSLLKLFEKLHTTIREQNAKERWEHKKTLIATAVRDSQYVVGVQTDEAKFGGAISEAPGVSEGSVSRPTVHRGSAE